MDWIASKVRSYKIEQIDSEVGTTRTYTDYERKLWAVSFAAPFRLVGHRRFEIALKLRKYSANEFSS